MPENTDLCMLENVDVNFSENVEVNFSEMCMSENVDISNIESCAHSTLHDGFCISCGLQISDQCILTHTSNQMPTTTNFSYKLESQKHTHLVNRLLHGLNISDHKPSILLEFSNKSFKTRLSMKDKLLLCTYKVLRDLSYPITFSDLEKYSTKIKSMWFKEYKYIPYTTEYIRNLVERYSTQRVDINEIKKMVEEFNNHPIEKVIKACVNNEKDLLKKRNKLKSKV